MWRVAMKIVVFVDGRRGDRVDRVVGWMLLLRLVAIALGEGIASAC